MWNVNQLNICDEIIKSIILLVSGFVLFVISYSLTRIFNNLVNRDKWNKLLIEEIEDNINNIIEIKLHLVESIDDIVHDQRMKELDMSLSIVTTIYDEILHNGTYYNIVNKSNRTKLKRILYFTKKAIININEFINEHNDNIDTVNSWKDDIHDGITEEMINRFNYISQYDKMRIENIVLKNIDLYLSELNKIKECQKIYTIRNRIKNIVYRNYMKNKVTEIIKPTKKKYQTKEKQR